MMTKTFTGVVNIKDFLNSQYKDTVFRMLVYRKMFTPHEMEMKYSDESYFESDFYTLVKIVGVFDFGKEQLIKFEEVGIDDELYQDEELETKRYLYYKLDDIVLKELVYEND